VTVTFIPHTPTSDWQYTFSTCWAIFVGLVTIYVLLTKRRMWYGGAIGAFIGALIAWVAGRIL